MDSAALLKKEATINSSDIKKNIGIGFSKLKGFAGKHPGWTTAAIASGAILAALPLMNQLSGAYNLINEQRKRKIMLGQSDYLKQIASSINNKNDIKDSYGQPFAVEPLA